jgi:glycosyltransferase involved in cell wall biosynthesis
MILTILTTTYKRPLLLKKLADSIIPLINKFNGKLKWAVIIDDITDEYDFVIKELYEKVKNHSFVNFQKHKNIGKFRSLSKLLNEDKKSDWVANIDDDDVIINFKFENFINIFDNINNDVKVLITPRLIVNTSIYNFFYKKKINLFSKYNLIRMSYFDFKDKFGDYDTVNFIRKCDYREYLIKEVENEKFTPESLRYLNAYPNKYDILILNKLLIYSQYLPGGITSSTNRLRILNPKSSMITHKKFLEYKKFNLSIRLIKSLVNYYRFNFHAKIKVNIFNDKFATLIYRFLGFNFAKIIFFFDKLFFKK